MRPGRKSWQIRRGWRALPLVVLLAAACGGDPGGDDQEAPVRVAGSSDGVEVPWNSGTLYFLLTDRFRNGDPTNDQALDRVRESAVLRGFEGGDLRGVLEKLEEGYFDALGVTAIWMTPFVEQVAGRVDEGTGATYGYHGYWARDWTRVDPALGTEEDLRAVVDEAHRRGIRVIMDAVINHPGPVTPRDPAWPEAWVRSDPTCSFQDYETTVTCELVDGLPDLRTDSDARVELPGFLRAKWEEEERLDDELAELADFFDRTGYPRAPRFYVMKWLTDWVREYGFDGYRVDTAKHFEEDVSLELAQEAGAAYEEWKAGQDELPQGDAPFWMLAEVYNYDLEHGRDFDFGDRTVDFFAHGYDALINFGFKGRARQDLDATYADYAEALRDGALAGVTVVNYMSSHDDGAPYDPERETPLEAGTRLLLAPGMAQIYYGDELARPLVVDSAVGDANLRSAMDWTSLDSLSHSRVLDHWRVLGRFRAAHPAVGAGAHTRLQERPYVFSRILTDAEGGEDRVVVALDAGNGTVRVPVGDVFQEGVLVRDAYSGRTGVVSEGAVSVETRSGVILLEASGRR
jgi:alpha-amylase